MSGHATHSTDETLAAFRETWPAFQREAINTRRLDTDTVRRGWPKPTIYREHETIHVLLNLIDHLRRELDADQPSETGGEGSRCPGCGHACCPNPGLECGGDSGAVHACTRKQ